VADRNDLARTTRRSLAELIVIVVGVLMALAVDDWRQTGEERRIERQAYVQLLEDLRLDSIDVVQARARAGNRLQAGLTLLERSGLPGSELTTLRAEFADELGFWDPRILQHAADSVGTELIALYGTNVFDPNRAALSSLIGGGELRLLRDPAVRTQLVSYASTVDARAEIQNLTRAAQTRFRMYLDSHGITVLDLLLKPDLDQVLFDDPRFPIEVKAAIYRAIVQTMDLSAIETRRAQLRALVAEQLR